MKYVLFIVGVLLIISGVATGTQATTVSQQLLAESGFGFGVLAIGLAALIDAVQFGFARLEKRLSSASKEKLFSPEPMTVAPSEPPLSEKPSMLDSLRGRASSTLRSGRA